MFVNSLKELPVTSLGLTVFTSRNKGVTVYFLFYKKVRLITSFRD